ncbi:MAG: hypothetical protein A2998_02960 [Candidatus Staskawiczbacteria bacterium RIFCSPLOWO2_01_FULL_37_25b]|uniref:Uncharacterized protein n=2 Tax=Candidatus Staskawicziibacteriota TaxID=1817916 RepID=A0A1G2HRU9_9BACT|nr:MAG: hypothetical protein A2812_01630 [Candidatus Staskawiczbacteria bacterium RIFCSPHIGHO2_01_FULL_36_16]OGZ72642.1 MAG: hypothetical protein A2998_02960 [Candidatus Staskawiczbacteria bacterium RIFCSPLOWO2_01_FULL_37_25b]
MEPIVLNEFGEVLAMPVSFDGNDTTVLGRGVRGKNSCLACAGYHQHCSGDIMIVCISNTHNALCCGRCNLRVVIPNEVATYGALRQWCLGRIEREGIMGNKDKGLVGFGAP